eukprot:CAMPEP_0179004686 /NCGR_PEP_ID=MMETSP0795-20121207/13455_1 /TAXON_ID=88552 /ORGANISM="Amoebophrya sp., Strain Ameob2" /LENGTH=319 /DNA_ID=CAMNT_0020699001 /DNA_START=273 /DNA_END=1232 /DNA_ORIENTATION=-
MSGGPGPQGYGQEYGPQAGEYEYPRTVPVHGGAAGNMGPPMQMQMKTLPRIGDSVQQIFAPRQGLTIKQTLKGCCCNRLNEFTVHEFHPDDVNQVGPELMFMSESAECCPRCMSHFAPGYRQTSFDMWCGAWSQLGESQKPKPQSVLLSHQKGLTFGHSCWIIEGDGGPVRVPCCCNLPYLETKDVNQQVLGKTQYECDHKICVPKYVVKAPDGTEWYRIRPDTCCGDCCTACEGSGPKGRCMAIPFYIRDPKSMQKLPGAEPGSVAAVNNLWSGVRECVNRQNYALRFPAAATPNQKATLVGSNVLIEMLHFEHEGFP